MSSLDALRSLRLQELDNLSTHAPLEFPEAPPPGFCPEAWFLGPKGENRELLQRLLFEALGSHVRHREEFHVGDPEIISGNVKSSQAYASAVRSFEQEARRLFEYLRWSAPISSMRHQGHMLWDQVLPAMVGYFAAMLYNQNNVAAEASPVTTLLELRVGEDLCSMLGFGPRSIEGHPKIVPWGRITCGGSIANIEALWAARNAKFFPIALREGIKSSVELRAARNIEVCTAAGKSALLVELSEWDLINLPLDEVVVLPERIFAEYKIETKTTLAAISNYTLTTLGVLGFARRFMEALTKLPVVFAPSTAHYSLPKGVSLLGLGSDALKAVPVDEDARMDIKALEASLKHCLRDKTPVLAVVAVIGTTEESAVDPLSDIVALREQFRQKGLDFAIHCDAAWGGYFASMLRHEGAPPVGGVPRPTFEVTDLNSDGADAVHSIPQLPMSSYVRTQMLALSLADSITVDPHKGGYVPYPAGALCYSNSALRDMVSLKAPVVYHSQAEPTVGVYGIEGSKPGAAAAAVWLAHRVIRPTRAGYGAILERCMWTATRFYCRLLTLEKRKPWLRLMLVPFSRLNVRPDDEDREIGRVAKFACSSNEEFQQQLGAGELGADLVINAFACNFYRDGRPNSSHARMNELNSRIFELCSATSPRDYGNDPRLELLLTASSFDPALYGQHFVNTYCARLGVKPDTGRGMDFLISTAMDPWKTDTEKGDFLEIMEGALCKAARRAIDDLGGD